MKALAKKLEEMLKAESDYRPALPLGVAAIMMYSHRYSSPLGDMFMSADDEGLTGLSFEEEELFPVPGEADLPVFDRTAEWLDTYFSGKEPDFTPQLHITGTDFQMEVWRLLLRIPYGEVVSYGEIARSVAALRGLKRMSAQAVGGAVGRNPIAIIVPCHRVIGSDGSLTGYGGGLDRKASLLEIERRGGGAARGRR